MNKLYAEYKEDASVKCLGMDDIIRNTEQAKSALERVHDNIAGWSRADPHLQDFQDQLTQASEMYLKSVSSLRDYYQALKDVEMHNSDQIQKGKRALRFQKK